MKELSIEEKAKRYDDTLKVANKYKDTHIMFSSIKEEMFPELKESEDERIRKELIKGISKTRPNTPFLNTNVTKEEALAWLEKQDELSVCNTPSREIILAIWELGNEWKELTNGCISTEHGTQLDYIQKHWHESEYYLKEKQGEQKSMDDIAKEVTKDKDAAISFLKSAGIMNENGELADEYKIEQGEQKSINGELSEFKDKLCELFQRFRWYKDETPTNGDILEYIDVHIQELFDSTNEQKLKWSEEDKEMKDWLIEYFKYRISNSNILEEKVNCKKALNWIESLHPQNRWKPSEEQMEALDDFIYAKYPNVEKYGAAVKSLYQDLKKLK